MRSPHGQNVSSRSALWSPPTYAPSPAKVTASGHRLFRWCTDSLVADLAAAHVPNIRALGARCRADIGVVITAFTRPACAADALAVRQLGTFAGAVLYALCTAAGPPVAAVYGLLVLSGVFFFGLLERRVRTKLAASRRLLLSSPP